MPSILSIQSHVVHGHVGNRASVFPLQTMGWDVDNINSVQFSNHTGYGKWKGTRTTAAELQDLYDGLIDRGFTYNALVTGYIPGEEAVGQAAKIGRDFKKRFPDSIWVLDPVMGDNGVLYVSDAVVPVYREAVRSGAVDIVSPNGFEAELLTGVKLDSMASIHRALDILHDDMKVPNVVFSSVELEGRSDLLAVASCKYPTDKVKKTYMFSIPKLEGSFTGTGDLFASLLAAQFHLVNQLTSSSDLPAIVQVLQTCLVIMGKVMHVTRRTLSKRALDREATRDQLIDARELQVVKCRDIFIDPASTALAPTLELKPEQLL